MQESRTDGATAIWTAPSCPFTIEYAHRPLDDIRLAVMDAFFSLPRGGAEIGGILLGQSEDGRLLINDYARLECEHAFGPSFTLSAQDLARLETLLASARQNPPGRQPVGWYHSHTRSGIFLSEADLEIHRRYFSEPFQIALVLKPHTFQPMRAGFFFRDPSGVIEAAASQHEFILEALPAQPVPAAAPPPGAPPVGRRHEPVSAGPVVDVPPAPREVPRPEPAPAPVAAAVAPAPAPQPEEEPPAPDLFAPKFLEVKEPSPWAKSGRWLGLILLAALGVGMAAAYQTRRLWIPRLTAAYAKVAPTRTIELNTLDANGQLQIRWNRGSSLILGARDAVLSITDGAAPQVIPLDSAHLHTGVFTYARRGERVDVAMTLRLPDGQSLRQATTFLGAPPAPAPAPAPAAPPATPPATPPAAADDPVVRSQRDTLVQQNAKLKTDLNWQTIQVKRLQRSVDDLRKQLQQERQRRLGNQNPDPGK